MTDVDRKANMLDTALKIAEHGPVLPCDPSTKGPLIRGGFHSASADPEQVRRWWQTWPDALVAIVPGEHGRVTLDLMPGYGPADVDYEGRWRKTPNGWHVDFAAAPGVSYGNGKRPDLGEAVDVIRHLGGYVIVAGPGYRQARGPLPVAPSTLTQPEHKGGIFSSGTSQPLDERDIIPSGDQEHAVHQQAFQIARLDPRPSEAAGAALLFEWITTHCPNTPGRAPWTAADALAKIRASYKAQIEHPIKAAVPKREGLALTDALDIERKVAQYVPGMRLKIPRGTISILTGQQGVGKGLLEVAEAAGVAKAGGTVLIASDEDAVSYTIRPRLEVALDGTDLRDTLRRVKMVAGLTLPEHTDELIALALDLDVRLLIVDPWTNHVGDIDINKGPELRAALMALAQAAEQGDFVALLTAHPNKNSENPDPLERVAHSQAITQVARSAFWIVRDPSDDAPETARVVAHVKHNLTARADTIAYDIETRRLEAPDDVVPLLVETGTCEHDWLTLHKLARQKAAEKIKTAKADAEQAIIAYLEACLDMTAMPRDVFDALHESHGFSESTVRRAATQLEARDKLERYDGGRFSTWKLLESVSVDRAPEVD